MIAKKFLGIVTCVAAVAMLPTVAAAQSSTFTIDFDRTGVPGTKLVDMIDPLTLEATVVPVDTGAFINPCTFENVDVIGRTTVTTLQTTDKFGTVKVDVSVVTKGTGTGWVPLPDGSPSLTGATYSFSDSQSFNFRLPNDGQDFSSDFSDKMSMKGAKSIDNWMLRAHFRIKVSGGVTQVLLIKTSGDACKG